MNHANHPNNSSAHHEPNHFILRVIREYQQNHPHQEIVLRFPPEPNGYLHIGHAKSICLNFGLALEFGGRCHLRFDDTNPEKESQEYVDAIKDLVKWLGFDWQQGGQSHLYYASDYFEQLYEMAKSLIQADLAYIDSQNAEEIKKNRGNLIYKGTDSPHRNRPTAESLAIFEGMRTGKYTEGEHVLRAKIDMAHANINMRDPIMYRIRYARHHRTGNDWCIYPMYDYTHCVSDALEKITHSICTLEFEDHRPLYDWFLENLQKIGYFKDQILPKQYEFARLNMPYILTSKRKLLQLVQEGHVQGWDDPRLPTLIGLRRRGFTANALRLFCERIGVSKSESSIDLFILEQALRDDLEENAPRVVAVLKPIKLILDNFDAQHIEWCQAPLHPHHDWGMRRFALTKELWIDASDIMKEPSKGFFRLFEGNRVRLRYGFVIECTQIICDENGNILQVHANYFADSKSGTEGSNNYKVKGNIHWLSADERFHQAITVNVYDTLFNVPYPEMQARDDMKDQSYTGRDKTFLDYINPKSKTILNAYLERDFNQEKPENQITANDKMNCKHYQFERHGYFVKDTINNQNQLINQFTFNQITGLKDTSKK